MLNLHRVLDALNKGAKPVNTHFGFIHHEPMGVWGIDQKGGGKSLAQTRLYVFAHEETHRLYLLTLGDKGTQRADIEDCKRFVDQIVNQA